MNKTDMNRRLATMSPELIEEVRRLVQLGYGGHGASLETTATVKQVNAVFALAQGAF